VDLWGVCGVFTFSCGGGGVFVSGIFLGGVFWFGFFFSSQSCSCSGEGSAAVQTAYSYLRVVIIFLNIFSLKNSTKFRLTGERWWISFFHRFLTGT